MHPVNSGDRDDGQGLRSTVIKFGPYLRLRHRAEGSGSLRVPLRLAGRKVLAVAAAIKTGKGFMLSGWFGFFLFFISYYHYFLPCFRLVMCTISPPPGETRDLLCLACVCSPKCVLLCVFSLCNPLLHPWFRFYTDPLWYQAFPVHV